ncbi:MAG: efflux RND transporter periplasmic adaptor subunit [Gammaproteobacteria bacterium]|nr:efflux RND transporter periplasmic adaptor subunit [Gammaproteobacteria bacterium]
MTKLKPIAAALMCAILIACEQAPVETPEVVRPVRMITISSLHGGDSLNYPGEIQGAQNVNIAFEVPGRIIEMPAQEGIEVSTGDALARLDPADFQSALDAAAARARASKETFDRFSEVFERGAISRQELDTRRRQYEVDQANLASAQKALDDTILRAPFDGRIGRTFVDNFANVQAKQEILLLQDLSEFEVVVNVPEQDWLRAKPGLTLAQQTERVQPSVSLSNLPGRSFPAAITEVAAAADPVTRTFAARARFDPPGDVIILPGMSATVTVRLPEGIDDTPLRVLVPANAVVGGNDGGSYVWKISSEPLVATMAPVTLGQVSGSEIEIVEGLEDGDRIAVSGVQHLAEGMRVRELAN